MSYQPIVIIGAPRSGTNMLRDILCQFQKVGTWPCDEINYIWKHGNIGSETDEFSVDMARPKVKEFIRKEFDNFASDNDLNFLFEKTCANSLRMLFVDQIIPEAKYIFIVRDGVDVVGSAAIRWKAKLDLSYIVKKVRYVPLLDIPYYALRYLGSRLYKFFSSEQRLSFWGPSYIGLYKDLKQHSLEEICALQWKHCVDSSSKSFSHMSQDNVIRVSYESYVKNPFIELKNILEFFNIPFDDDGIKKSIASVTSDSIGKGRKALDEDSAKNIERLISSTLKNNGYL